MAGTGKLLSIVVPVFNEELAIEPFLEALWPHLHRAVLLMGGGSAAEIVFVDDGSTDATVAAVAAARMRHPEVKLVILSRNFGKDAALAAGLAHARGDAAIPMDVDLQDPPEVVPQLVAEWLAGAQVVNAQRIDRSLDSYGKRLTSRAFYRAYNALADRPISGDVGDFRLIDRSILDVLNTLPERSRFMKGLVSWVGFRSATVPYVRAARVVGSTKWNYWKLWNFALDGITASTTTPLRIWTYVGVAIAAAAFLYAGFIVVLTVLLGRETPGFASLMTAVLLLGGLNLVALGVLGEYIGRISTEVKGRPLYIVSSALGFQEGAVARDAEAVGWKS